MSTAVQQAIYDLMTGDAPLIAAVKGVYDSVPQSIDSGDSTAFPYIVIGEDNHTSFAQDDAVGAEVSVVIHVWSRHRGRSEVKSVQSLIFNALSRAEIAVSGRDTITIEWENDQSFVDADGLTRHGVSTYRLLIL